LPRNDPFFNDLPTGARFTFKVRNMVIQDPPHWLYPVTDKHFDHVRELILRVKAAKALVTLIPKDDDASMALPVLETVQFNLRREMPMMASVLESWLQARLQHSMPIKHLGLPFARHCDWSKEETVAMWRINALMKTTGGKVDAPILISRTHIPEAREPTGRYALVIQWKRFDCDLVHSSVMVVTCS
jgi:hypothetical protein